MTDPEVESLLADIGIVVPDTRDLFEVFDADCTGKIELEELLRGFFMLYGGWGHMHVVATLLSVQSAQKRIGWLEKSMTQSMATSTKLLNVMSKSMTTSTQLLEAVQRISYLHSKPLTRKVAV